MSWCSGGASPMRGLPAHGLPSHGLPGRGRLARALLAAAALALAGCGFHLRGQAEFHFESIFVNAPGAPAMAGELRHLLTTSGSARVAEDPAKARVILDIPLVVDDKDVLSLSPGGRAREFALTKHVQIALRDNDGNVWLPPDEIIVRRTYLYDDTERLARQIQEGRLLQEMQTEAVHQIVRRLQAARKPG